MAPVRCRVRPRGPLTPDGGATSSRLLVDALYVARPTPASAAAPNLADQVTAIATGDGLLLVGFGAAANQR